ncbi:MAG TPA: gamma-glutamyltransferase family protein [Polyangiaceae bacterium]|nr:gamma-glutamyltransferase family protein [Polyangiaceae bacterium]
MRTLALFALACAGLLGPLFPSAVTATPNGGSRAVATESAEATRAALGILRSGGNAIDAAIAAALVAGVATPASSGLGGGGFAVVWSVKEAKVVALDFRESAPRAFDVEAFERRPLPPAERGKAVGVPGEAKGLYELHARFGKLPWADLVKPAIGVAKAGFVVSPHLARTIAANVAKIAPETALLDLFAPGGKPDAAGTRVKNPRLARTLERVAAEGPRSIYEGPIAAELVSAVARTGGALSQADLDAYRPVERVPLHVTFEGKDVYTMPLPSAGGFLLAETLGSVTREDLTNLGFGTSGYVHWIAEIFRGAFADRLRLAGDPAFEHVDLSALLDPKRLAERRRARSLQSTLPMEAIPVEEHGTHHLVVADELGNVVSLTTTVNNAFGAKLVATESGIVLNDQLDDFTARAGVERFGLRESPNRARSLARPVSSMTPTLVFQDGKPLLAAGGSGGLGISVSVTEVLLARLVFGMPEAAAIAAPGFGIPLKDGTISLDSDAPPGLWKSLERRGETVVLRTMPHAVQLVSFDAQGRKRAFADARKSGSAAVE